MDTKASSAAGYAPTAKFLHWLVVVLLLVQYAVAWAMPHIGRNTKPDTLINLHFSLGLLILLVLLCRLAWRLTHTEPAPLDGIAPWQVITARIVHWLLYVLLLVIPVLGWLNASYRGFDLSFFGIVGVPRLLAPRAPGWGWTGDTHMVISYYVLLSLVGIHIAAALYHWLILKDGVIERMLPGRGR